MPLLSLLNLEHTAVSCQCRGASVSFRLCRIVALGYNGAFNAARCRVMAVISYALPPSPSAPCSSNSIPSLAQPLRPPTLAHRPRTPQTNPIRCASSCMCRWVGGGLFIPATVLIYAVYKFCTLFPPSFRPPSSASPPLPPPPIRLCLPPGFPPSPLSLTPQT